MKQYPTLAELVCRRIQLPSDPEGCWLWRGVWHEKGYGTMHSRRFGHFYAHRLTYEMFVGPIPTGLHIDHLCRNPSCVNPAHLEPVTCRENVLRGKSPSAAQAKQTHCKRGHLLAGQNLKINRPKTPTAAPSRVCRACQRVSENRSHARKMGKPYSASCEFPPPDYRRPE